MTRLQRQSLALLLSLLIFMVAPGCAGTGGKTNKAKLDIQADAARLEEQTGLTVVSVLIDLPTEASYAPAGEVMQKTLRNMPGYMKDFMLKIEFIPPTLRRPGAGGRYLPGPYGNHGRGGAGPVHLRPEIV